MSDKITLPGQIQHSNPLFSVVDVNDVKGGIKSVETFDSTSLATLYAEGSDKFLKNHTIILEQSSGSFFWLNEDDASDVNNWSPITIEQDNKFKIIHNEFMVGGRSIYNLPLEELIRNTIQSYFDRTTFIISEVELLILSFGLTVYGVFSRQERKYIMPSIGKGTYGPGVFQYDDLEIIYQSDDQSSTPVNIGSDANNIIFDLGEISGNESVDLSGYLSINGPYNLTDINKIYYFKFLAVGVEYLYYFDSDIYGIYGLGENPFLPQDLTLFYSSNNVQVSTGQDNRFRFVEFFITKDFLNITVSSITNLIRTQVDTNLFVNNSLTVYDTELIIFKFTITDIRIRRSFTWKYFFKNLQGKGYYSPIFPTIKFSDLEVINQDLTYFRPDLTHIQNDINNVILPLGDMSSDSAFVLLFESDIDSAINNYLIDNSSILLPMTDNSKIYFISLNVNGVDYLYYYSGSNYTTYKFDDLFDNGDIILFYSSNNIDTDPISSNNNIPRTYRILSTDIDKPLLDIKESDVINYVNNIDSSIVVGEYDSMMIFDVYQPSIEIEFDNIYLSGVPNIDNRYSWDSWMNDISLGSKSLTRDNRIFEFSDTKISTNPNTSKKYVSLIGDLNELDYLILPDVKISRLKFGNSKLRTLSFNNDVDVLDISNLLYLEQFEIYYNLPELIISSNRINRLDIFSDNIGSFSFPVQILQSKPMIYNIWSDTFNIAHIELIIDKLVQSPVANVGTFGVFDFNPSNYNPIAQANISTLTSRGWFFTSLIAPILPGGGGGNPPFLG